MLLSRLVAEDGHERDAFHRDHRKQSIDRSSQLLDFHSIGVGTTSCLPETFLLSR